MTGRRVLSEAVDGALEAARGVGRIGSALGSLVGLPPKHQPAPGTAAGLEYAFDVSERAPEGAVRMRVIDYGRDGIEERAFDDLERLLTSPRPEGASVRWINVDGLHPQVVDRLRRAFGVHTLAAEDVMHVPQRPRMEAYSDHAFITARMVRLEPSGALLSEQVSLFLFEGLLLTFQEREGDVFEPIRERLRQDGSRLRGRDAGFLAYALLDAIVDHCFPLLERYAELLEVMEDEIMRNARPEHLQAVLATKKDLGALRRIVWPTRDLVDTLKRSDTISPATEPFLLDVYTHTTQLADLLEAHRDTAAGLVDLYMSMVSNRMNEVMKVLTIIATLFIPITFVAGVYGMNFKHIPELEWRYAYAAFWLVCATLVSALLWFFRRRGWL